MKTKYDWSGVPKEINWIGTTQYKDVIGFYEMPQMIGTWLAKNHEDYIELDIDPYQGNWQDSLEERPNE